jgi:hypothetical protein
LLGTLRDAFVALHTGIPFGCKDKYVMVFCK